MKDGRKKLFFSFPVYTLLVCLCLAPVPASAFRRKLRFGRNGQFKILQVADMHYRFGANTTCKNVPEIQMPFCSDLNTTSFLRRTIAAEKPDLIVFAGDILDGWSDGECMIDAVKSLDAALAPAIKSRVPWVAILGNHDQECDLTREQLMKYMSMLPNSLSQVNPVEAWHYIDGFGNYNLEVAGAFASAFHFKSVLNLYFLDSGDYAKKGGFLDEYDWIKTSQQLWFERTSKWLERAYMSKPNPQKGAAPGLAYFHIPLPEFSSFDATNVATGVRQEDPGPAYLNSGFFSKMFERGDVKGVFVGHAHKNDFCGNLHGINLCHAGGFGYHAYGLEGWPRRARVVVAQLEKAKHGRWGDVESITTWKRLDDQNHSVVDTQVLWTKNVTVPDGWWPQCEKRHL